MKTWIAIGMTALTVCGCKPDASKKQEDSAESAEPKRPRVPSAFEPWMPKDAAQLWQGAWSSRITLQSSKKGYTSMAGDPAALAIKDDKATVFDGSAEYELGFTLPSPCEATFAEKLKEGTAYHTMFFVVQNGAIVVGSGAAGYRKGKTAVVCSEGSNGGVHIVGETECKTWSKRFDQWESKPNTCVWSQVDGKDVLTIGTDKWNTVVSADGDVLMSDQFRQFVKEGYHTRANDFAAAKAQVSAKLKASDPAEQAKAAGGVVGKTDTIVSLIATFASDKALKGKPFEISARYLNSNTITSNGTTTYNVILVDSKDATSFSIPCDLGKTAPPEGLVQYDTVTAKGTLGELFGKPSLESCTLTK